MKKALYIGNYFNTEDLISLKVKLPSLAGVNSEKLILNQIIKPLYDEVIILSIKYNNFFSKNLVKKGKLIYNSKYLKIKSIFSINFPLFSKLIQFFSLLFNLIKFLNVKNHNIKILFLYNCFFLTAFPTYLVSRLFNIKFIVFQFDGYYNLQSKNLILKLYIKLSTYILNKAHLVITLNKNIIHDFVSKNTKSLVMTPLEDFKANYKINNLLTSYSDKFNVVFTGSLEETNGLLIIFEVIKFLLPYEKIFFHICGDGHYRSIFIENSLKNFKFYGQVSNDFSRQLQYESDLQLAIRPFKKDDPIVKYGLPWKILEYISSKSLVLVNSIPSIPKYFHPYILFTTIDPLSISKKILNISKKSYNYDYQSSSFDKLLFNHSWENYRLKISKILNE